MIKRAFRGDVLGAGKTVRIQPSILLNSCLVQWPLENGRADVTILQADHAVGAKTIWNATLVEKSSKVHIFAPRSIRYSCGVGNGLTGVAGTGLRGGWLSKDR